MKVGVVGVGAVGAACAVALVTRGSAREIVLVNRDRKRAVGVATDLRYGTPLTPTVEIRDGEYGDLAGCAAVLITAGVNEKSGGATDRGDPEGRLRLLDANAGVYAEIVPKIVAAAPRAVLVVVTDPPDPLADLARRLARHDRVLSTGTFLDSLRFRVHLGRHLGVHPASIDAQVIGEHGTTEVLLWSSARVAGVPVLDALAQHGEPPPAGTSGRRDAPASPGDLRSAVEHEVRYANISIIEGIGASQYGIGVVSARIAEMILRDEQTVTPIGAYQPAYGITFSLPGVVGADGVGRRWEPPMSDDERAALQRSIETLREATKRTLSAA
jgi:L-lactate dehydrogenase